MPGLPARLLAAPVFLLFAALPTSLPGGHHRSDNFDVLTPSEPTPSAGQALAELVAARAESYRREIAVEWLGDELPEGVGRTTINVEFSGDESGYTWAIDHPDRTMHTVYLKTTAARAAGEILKHEIAHVVLATRFPHPKRLPTWIEEGIASRYDDPQRTKKREGILDFYSRTGNWPELLKTLRADRFASKERGAYAQAVSVTDFLLERGGHEKFIEFAETARDDLDRGLRRCYGLNDVEQLAGQWRKWVTR